MTQLYKLNLERCKKKAQAKTQANSLFMIVEELKSFKRELEIVKETKESEEKEAIQRAAALRTEIQVRRRIGVVSL